jgi:hypothetical protein
MEFSRVERAAIEAILSKPVDGMDVLRAQFATASVVKRDHTGVGFYTTISVPPAVPAMRDSAELREALFAGSAGSPGVFFMLWTEAGYLACLEGITIHRSWPNDDDIQEIVPCRIARKPHRGGRRTRSSQDALIPDGEDRFEVWRMNTSARSLLVTGLLIVFVMVVVLMVIGIVL